MRPINFMPGAEQVGAGFVTRTGPGPFQPLPPVPITDNPAPAPWFPRLAAFALVVAMLRLAEAVLLPIAFALLLAFLLSPLVVRLARWGVPRALAIVLSVSLAFAAIGGLGWLVAAQAAGLMRELPNYEGNIRAKVVALKTPFAPTLTYRMSEMVASLRREFKAPAPAGPAPAAPASGEAKPVPVEVKPSESTPWEIARDLISPLVRPLGTAGVVVVFVIAILFQREDLRERFIRLVSQGHLHAATQAVDDAAARVSRYLAMQLVVNAIYGVSIGAGLFFIGIPNAPLWGLLATLLRFIPFAGPWIAAAFPLALSLAVEPGWTLFAWTLGLFITMELISNNLIEVVLYGTSTGISNLALLVAVVFWTWLWGAAGLVLATPLTVCVLVMGNHVPGMRFLGTLLGSAPALEPPAQLYERMFAMESEEISDLAAKHIAAHSLEEFYEDVLVPALLLAEEDRHRGALSETRERFIFQACRDLIDELEHETAERRSAGPVAMPAIPAIIGLPARDEADEIVAALLCHLLRRHGIHAAVTPLAAPVDEAIKALERPEVRATFISALPPAAVNAARQMCSRVKQRLPGTPVLVGVWQHRSAAAELGRRLQASRPDGTATTLRAAVTQLEALARGIHAEPATNAAVAPAPLVEPAAG